MADALTFEDLQQAVQTGTAARCRVKLQPAAGEGTKVFPPTYAGAVYASEKRRLPDYDEPVECVLLDSVQSQANRMEEALQQAIDNGRLRDAGLSVPLIEVDFTPFFPGENQDEDSRLIDPVGKITSLQAPHRIADAILRDSIVNEEEKPFRCKNENSESEYGRKLRRVSVQNATPLFELCPTALLFGMWDSTGPKGGMGAKIERAMVSEIVGINAAYGVKTSSRIDPLGIQREAGVLYQASSDDGIGWTLDESQAKSRNNKALTLGKDGRPSEGNHGNVTPSLSSRDKETQEYLEGGVTIDYAEQSTVISFPALRRLRFPVEEKIDRHIDGAAQTVIAALGLCSASFAAESGLDLRSRCLLWPIEPLSWELLTKPGESPRKVVVDAGNAISLLKQAVEHACELGLPWLTSPVVLTPSIELVKLVRKSQELTVRAGGDQ